MVVTVSGIIAFMLRRNRCGVRVTQEFTGVPDDEEHRQESE